MTKLKRKSKVNFCPYCGKKQDNIAPRMDWAAVTMSDCSAEQHLYEYWCSSCGGEIYAPAKRLRPAAAIDYLVSFGNAVAFGDYQPNIR